MARRIRLTHEVEDPVVSAQAAKLWSEAEREDFVCWIAANPEAGDVIPGADGARKVRWAASGRGKRGGARVIYFNQLADGLVILIAVPALLSLGLIGSGSLFVPLLCLDGAIALVLKIV